MFLVYQWKRLRCELFGYEIHENGLALLRNLKKPLVRARGRVAGIESAVPSVHQVPDT